MCLNMLNLGFGKSFLKIKDIKAHLQEKEISL